MKATSIHKQLNTYLPLLTSDQQELLLDMVKNILQIEPQKKRISKSQYNKELNRSIAQARSGKVISHADLLKEIDKW